MKALIITLLLILCIPLILSGQTNTWHGLRYQENPVLDGWSIVNAGKGAALYTGLRVLKVDRKWSLALAIGTTFMSELIIDGYQNDWLMKADPAGADFFGDTCWAALGAGLACIIDLLFDINNKLSFENNRLTLRLPCK